MDDTPDKMIRDGMDLVSRLTQQMLEQEAELDAARRTLAAYRGAGLALGAALVLRHRDQPFPEPPYMVKAIADWTELEGRTLAGTKLLPPSAPQS